MNYFNFCKTCIGSAPHKNKDGILKEILNKFREIPFWPQLPKRNFLENMYVQFAENLPGCVIDEKSCKIYIDREKDFSEALEKAFQKYIDGDLDFFSISKEYAEGFYGLLDKKNEISNNRELKCLKGHVTGPISFGLTIKDNTGKSILYFKEFEELLPKFLSMKARWQIKKLKALCDDVIIFIDEPYLTSIGSSFVNIDKDKTLSAIREVSSSIKDEGALSGLHCCGNTEWDFVLNSGIDIISFDAYNFTKEFLLYHEAIGKFLNRGGVIAWGIVPTSSEDLKKANTNALIKKVTDAIKQLDAKGMDKKEIIRSSIVTPSCGCGSLTEEECGKIFQMLEEVAHTLRTKYRT